MRFGGGYLWVTLDDEDAVARIDVDGRRHAHGRGRATAPPSPCSPAVTCSSPAATTTRSSSWTRRRCGASGEPIAVGFNPFAMAADERSVWVTGLGDNTLTRIDYAEL